MNQEWNVGRIGERCASCARTFAVGDWVRAVLYPDGDAYLRRDFCADCRAADEALSVGCWRARRQAPATPKARSFDRDALLEFFANLAADATPEKLEFRFVLALFLWRKKILRLDESAGPVHEPGGAGNPDGSREVWQFVQPGEGVRHAVVRPDIDDERIDRLSESLEGLLAGDIVVGAAAAELSDARPMPEPASAREPAGA